MINNKELIGVALTKCYLCGKGNEIIMNTCLSEKAANGVTRLHNQIISRAPCSECEGYMKQGVIVITFDDSKTSPDVSSTDDLYRDGGFYVVKDVAIQRLIAYLESNGKVVKVLKKSLVDRIVFLPGKLFRKWQGI